MSDRANVLIAGGGVVGTALAWALAARGVRDVVVVDLDLAGVYASSELNAGGARATWWQPVNIATCRLTLDFFREHADEFGFREAGYLWLYDDDALFAQARRHRDTQNREGLGVELLAPGDVLARFPIVDRHTDALVGATFSPRDGLVNPNAVRAFYRREAHGRGVHFLDRHYIAGVRTQRVTGAASAQRRIGSVEVVEVEAGHAFDAHDVVREILCTHHVPAARAASARTIECDTVVNCLGALSPIFAAKIGVSDVTQPVRRQIALVDVHRSDWPDGVDLDAQGMIVDPSGLYFHPEGGHVLAGYSTPDEPPGYDFAYDGDDFFTAEIWPRLAHRCSAFERCGHVRGWAGLYAVTPDCSGIAGAVAGFSNLFEAHSFTGRGVMQSYGVAANMAARIATGSWDDVDLGVLARDRFGDPTRHVREDLHI